MRYGHRRGGIIGLLKLIGLAVVLCVGLAIPGLATGVRGIYRVIDIPDGVATAEVVRLLNGTAILGRHTLRFDELGIGRIVHQIHDEER
jgi:hypothetical protein